MKIENRLSMQVAEFCKSQFAPVGKGDVLVSGFCAGWFQTGNFIDTNRVF